MDYLKDPSAKWNPLQNVIGYGLLSERTIYTRLEGGGSAYVDPDLEEDRKRAKDFNLQQAHETFSKHLAKRPELCSHPERNNRGYLTVQSPSNRMDVFIAEFKSVGPWVFGGIFVILCAASWQLFKRRA